MPQIFTWKCPIDSGHYERVPACKSESSVVFSAILAILAVGVIVRSTCAGRRSPLRILW